MITNISFQKVDMDPIHNNPLEVYRYVFYDIVIIYIMDSKEIAYV